MSTTPSTTIISSGLGTTSYSAPATGSYFVDAKCSLPTLTSGAGASSVVITIAINGSTKYTGQAGAAGAYISGLSCTQSDVITVVLSSSAAPDLVANAIKSSISFGLGE